MKLWWDSWHSSSGFAHPRPIPEWEERFESLYPEKKTFVANLSNSLVGFIMMNHDEREISQLFVSPHFQRRYWTIAISARFKRDAERIYFIGIRG